MIYGRFESIIRHLYIVLPVVNCLSILSLLLNCFLSPMYKHVHTHACMHTLCIICSCRHVVVHCLCVHVYMDWKDSLALVCLYDCVEVVIHCVCWRWYVGIIMCVYICTKCKIIWCWCTKCVHACMRALVCVHVCTWGIGNSYSDYYRQ